ncbi:MAG: 50S ribosomal protein L29 [Planctomycetaceae bacterium]
MTKIKELRDMSDEQVRLVWKDAAEVLFKMRLQAQTEKLASPTDLRKHRRTIARCQTLLGQRGSVVAPAAGPDGAPAEVKTQHDAVVHGKHAKQKRLAGRAKVKAPGKGAIASRRRFQKRTQSGK